MEGLINRAMAEQHGIQQVPEQEQPPAQANEEVDEAYDNIVAGALRLLRSPQMLSEIKSVVESESIAQGMSSVAYGALSAVGAAAGEIPEEYAVPLAVEVLGYVAEAVEAYGGKVKGRDIAEALVYMMEQYSIESGMTPQEFEQFRSQVDVDAVGQQVDAELAKDTQTEAV